MLITSSEGSPTVSSTITIVTSPACGMPAAPMLAAVAVTLRKNIVNAEYGRVDDKLKDLVENEQTSTINIYIRVKR